MADMRKSYSIESSTGDDRMCRAIIPKDRCRYNRYFALFRYKRYGRKNSCRRKSRQIFAKRKSLPTDAAVVTAGLRRAVSAQWKHPLVSAGGKTACAGPEWRDRYWRVSVATNGLRGFCIANAGRDTKHVPLGGEKHASASAADRVG
jgi:hypothetical protein